MIPLRLSASITMKAAAGKSRRFNILAYSGGKLPVEGFPAPVVVDLTGLEVPGNIPILIDHTQSVEATLGITDAITNDGKTLVMAGAVTGVSPLAKQVVTQADGGHTWQASIGTLVIESVMVEAGQSVEVNGQVQTGPFVLARKSVLRETSVLPMGADSSTLVNLAARAALSLKGAATLPTIEEWLKSKGIDAAALTPDEMAAFQLAYDALQAPAATATATAPAPVAAAPAIPATAAAGAQLDLSAQFGAFRSKLREIAAEEAGRQAEIHHVTKDHPQILKAALAGGWSKDKAELEVMRVERDRTRPTSFNSTQNAPENMPKVLEAALCVTRRMNVEKQYSDAVLQAAHSQFRRGLGLQQLLLTAAAHNGHHVAPGERITSGNVREYLQAAFNGPQMLQASGGFSTISVSGILGNVMNKEALEGYMEEDQAWREISAIKTVSDFKEHTSYRLLDNVEYEELGPGGVIKHGTVGEESYTRQADTYAKMAAITRKQIINDDLGAFDDMRARVGRGSAKKLNSVFWTAFVNNSTFFTTARTNYIEGSTTNLGTDGVGLGLGVKQFRKMTSPSADGSKRVGAGLTPQILLVGPSNEAAAELLFRNQNLGAVASSSANIYANKYRPVIAWQLEDSAYTGYSTTAWYLLADPRVMPTMVVSFLNGQETPTVESADADFDQLGIQIRGYHDFGCDVAEYLGGLKSKGAA